jgi:dephospho-CoA kinase
MVLSAVGFRCIGPGVCITDRESVFSFLINGNIACGKGTVGQLLADRTSDYRRGSRGARLVRGSTELRAIAERFGADLLRDDGTIDRRRLGDRVLGNSQALRDLEDLLGPGVRAAIEQRLESSSSAVVVLDAIRLVEAGLVERCQAVWVVTCERDAQIARLMASRAMTEEKRRYAGPASDQSRKALRHRGDPQPQHPRRPRSPSRRRMEPPGVVSS